MIKPRFVSDPMTLDIVIVNWNAGAALAQCVSSIPPCVQRGVEVQRVVVVDNASTDGSADRLDAGGLPLVSLRNRENRGFGAACNQGAAGSGADYLLFLNPDTRLDPESLAVPLEYLEAAENAGVGILGIQLVGEDGTVSRSSARFPTAGAFWTKLVGLDRLAPRRFQGYVMEEWPHDSTREVDHVIGAFYMVRRALFESVGGFDERFFVYLEDLDLSFRARRAGWRIVYLADARAYHKGGGTSDQVKARRLFYALRSRMQYANKHLAPRDAALVALGTLCLEPVVRVSWSLARGSVRAVAETLQAYGMLWADALPSRLYRRPGGGTGQVVG